MKIDWGTNKSTLASGIGLAVLSPIVTLLACQRVARGWPEGAALSFFLLPVAACAYLCGFWPGTVATFLSCFLADYFLIEPVNSISLTPVGAAYVVALAAVGIAVSFLLDGLRRQAGEPEGDATLRAIERRVRLASACAVAMILAIAVVSYHEVGGLHESDAWVDHTDKVIGAIRRVDYTLLAVVAAQRNFVITGDETYLAEYAASTREMYAELSTLRELVSDNPGQGAGVQKLEQYVAERLAVLQLTSGLRESQGPAAAAATIAAGKGRRLDETISKLSAEMEGEEQKLLEEREARSSKTELYSRNFIGFGSLLAFGVVAVALSMVGQDFAGSRRARAELQQSREELRVRVLERTAELEESNRELRMSRESYAVTLASIGDAVITTDLECMVTFMNAEAEALTGWKKQEAAGQRLSEVFQIVNEDSGKALTNPARLVLDSGQKQRLANHTALVKRDGTSVPIADSGAPIRDEEGKIVGTVLVFRDYRVEREKESALRERLALQDQLANITEAVPGVILSYLQRSDGSARFTYASPAIEDLYGFPREVLMQDAAPFFERVAAQDVGPLRRAIADSARELTMWKGEFGFNHPRKGRIWVEGAAVPRCLPDGSTEWHGFLHDVSERRRTVERAMEEEARLSAIVHSALSAIITVDEEMNILLFNPAAEEIFQCSENEAMGRPLDRFLPERYRTAHREHMRSFGETDIRSRTMGERLGIFGRRSNGEEFPVEASISHATFSGRKIFTVILRDVTEQHKAQEALRQQARLLDLAPVLVRDIEDRIVFWSEGACNIYGFTKEEAMGRKPHELLQTEFPEPLENVRRKLNANGVWRGELRHRSKSGELVHAASQWVLYLNQQTQITHILEVNSDVTALRKAEELHLQAQKLEALGTLAGGIAHDFNNVMLAISGNATLAKADISADHPAQQNIAAILKAGARASELVKRILSFSRPQEEDRRDIRLQPLVEEALKLVRATMPARIAIETKFEESLPPVKVNAGQIIQVVVNLATNASHAIGDKNGTIRLELGRAVFDAGSQRKAAELAEGNYVRLEVSDDGCGMEAAVLQRIFDPFFTTKKLGEGTGLGLSVVHGIISSYGGAINVTSKPGRGSRFQLFFPIGQEYELEKDTAAAVESQHGRQENILYLDDDGDLVYLMSRLLERKGYRVTGFSKGSDALAAFREEPDRFDAVVTDLSMPEMSGLEFAKCLRGVRGDTPIILISGYLQEQDETKAEELNIRAVIEKSADIPQIVSSIAKVMGTIHQGAFYETPSA